MVIAWLSCLACRPQVCLGNFVMFFQNSDVSVAVFYPNCSPIEAYLEIEIALMRHFISMLGGFVLLPVPKVALLADETQVKTNNAIFHETNRKKEVPKTFHMNMNAISLSSHSSF